MSQVGEFWDSAEAITNNHTTFFETASHSKCLWVNSVNTTDPRVSISCVGSRRMPIEGRRSACEATARKQKRIASRHF